MEKVKASELRLTKLDNEIYEHFQKDFPEVDVSKVIDEDAMKSKEGKERWRKFMQAYEKRVRLTFFLRQLFSGYILQCS